jgi:hypothetical protein
VCTECKGDTLFLGDSDLCVYDRYAGWKLSTTQTDRLALQPIALGHYTFTDDYSSQSETDIDTTVFGPQTAMNLLFNHAEMMMNNGPTSTDTGYRETYRPLELHHDRGFFMKGHEDVLSIGGAWVSGGPMIYDFVWDMH